MMTIEDKVSAVLASSEALSVAVLQATGIKAKFNISMKGKRPDVISIESEPLERSGVLALMVKEITLGAFGGAWVQADTETTDRSDPITLFEMHAQYSGQTNGSNGMGLGMMGQSLYFTLERARFNAEPVWTAKLV